MNEMRDVDRLGYRDCPILGNIGGVIVASMAE